MHAAAVAAELRLNMEWLEKGFGSPYLDDVRREEERASSVAEAAAQAAKMPPEYIDADLMERCMAAVHRARPDEGGAPTQRIRLACMLYDLFRHATDSSVEVMSSYIRSRM